MKCQEIFFLENAGIFPRNSNCFENKLENKSTM
jgi:hypothetical protein